MNIERIYTSEDLEDNEEELEKLNCPFCLRVGLYIPLGPKILMPNEEKQPDYENWLQCSRCAEIIPIYQVEPEESIKDEVTTIQNPFDESKGEVIGVNRGSKAKRRKKFQTKPHKDKEIQDALNKGLDIKIISESNP